MQQTLNNHQLTKEEKKGAFLLCSIFAIYFLVDIYTLADASSTKERIVDIARIILTVFLMSQVWRGMAWAKWIFVCCVLFGSLLIMLFLLLGARSIFLFAYLVYPIASSCIILFSPAVNAFLRKKNNNLKADSGKNKERFKAIANSRKEVVEYSLNPDMAQSTKRKRDVVHRTSKRNITYIDIPFSLGGGIGGGNLFGQIPFFGKTFLRIWLEILQHDGHMRLLVISTTIGLLIGIITSVVAQTSKLPAFPVAIIMCFFIAVSSRSWRYYANDLNIGSNKMKKFSLYLRPFKSDERAFFQSFAIAFRYRDVPLTGALGKNIMAMGSPHDLFPRNLGFNVSLRYAEKHLWQEIVIDLISRADRVWIQLGQEEWVQWEIRKISELNALEKTAFILPTKLKEESWRVMLSNLSSNALRKYEFSEVDISRAMIVGLASSESIIVVKSERNSPDDFLPALYAFRYALIKQ